VTLTYSGADLVVVPGVEFRVSGAKQHYRLGDGRVHYSSSGTD
jgi:5-formyltetrahydrofolate cyclo-ligase